MSLVLPTLSRRKFHGVTVASGLGYYLVTRASGRQSAKVLEFKRWITREVKATMAGFGSQRYPES